MKNKNLQDIKQIYNDIKPGIEKQLKKFKKIWEQGTDEELFIELAFCLFTPQSKARTCWQAVELLLQKDLVFNGQAEEIRKVINIVRFRNKKSEYLVCARKLCTKDNRINVRELLKNLKTTGEKRDWLVKNIKGYGYKEASHLLRNIGFGEDIAILDRHILKNLVLLGVINSVPDSITGKKYFEIENKMKDFSKKTGIPMSHLDFVLWYKETRDIFK